MNAYNAKFAEAFVWHQPHASSTGSMLSLARAYRMVADWSRRRRTSTELNALTDRELADIGLTRGDIGHIVNGGR